MQTKLSLFCEKLIEAGWLAALILVPVFFNVYSARTFEPDKLTLMRSITLMMILAWLIKLAETGVGQENRQATGAEGGVRSALEIPLFLPTLLLVLSYVVSTIFSISPKVALWGSYQRLQGTYTALSYIVIFVLMATHLRTRAQVDRLIATVILTSLPVGLYGVIQHYGLDPLPWAGDVVTRVASNMGNSIFVASYLIMVIPLILARLIDSMSAILRDEEASWGHTVLAAVYIFILAVDIITVIFSQSRGPLLGLLAGLFIFVFLGLLTLSRKQGIEGSLTVGGGLYSLLETAAFLGFGGALGALWFRLVGPIPVGQTRLDLWALIAAGILLGVIANVLAIALRVALRWGWGRLWFNWALLAVLVAVFIVSLNLPDSPFLSLRPLPTVGRLTQLFQPGEGSGRVRVLIWEGVLRLITPHDPIGISDEFSDQYNFIRPLIGYGPESMFNAFAKVYPPELAHVEQRGSSADRSHNETFDALAMMGLLGFFAYYFLMFSLFYYLLKAAGWIQDEVSRRRLIVLLGLGGVLGGSIPRLVTGDFVFSGLGLPAGMLFTMFVYLIWQTLARATESGQGDDGGDQSVGFTGSTSGRDVLLLIGIFAALVAHFVEVHFVFSIAATYVYFWTYAGVVVARIRWGSETTRSLATSENKGHQDAVASTPRTSTRSTRKRRRRRRKPASLTTGGATSPSATTVFGEEDWETWLGVFGLVVAIILMAMIFDFVTVHIDVSRGRFSMIWMFAITWGLAMAVGLSEVAIRDRTSQKPLNWGRAVLLFAVTSLGYTFFYLMVHRLQLKPRSIPAVDPVRAVIKNANVFTGSFLLFYAFVWLLLLLVGLMLALPAFRRQPTWRVANWWLYPILILATGVGIWFKNINVVRADIYLKQGEQYRDQGQYDNAIVLHKRSIDSDPDEDFYYLMLALDYQLKGQDGRISEEERTQAWAEGVVIATQAREINPYNPDNTGNLGRYFFTWAQFTPADDAQWEVRLQNALQFFERAIKLAPQNVVYYNLLGQTHSLLGQFEQAEQVLLASAELDPEFEQTQVLLGDTYATLGRAMEAAEAHRAAILLSPAVFADQLLDQRLNFYLSASQVATNPDAATSDQDDVPIQHIISALEEAQSLHPGNVLVPQILGRTYALMGDSQRAVAYYEQAIGMGDTSAQTLLSIADIYLNSQAYEQAIVAYQRALQVDPQNVQAHSNLGYAYTQVGRLDDAIQENLQVLQLAPDDYISHRNLVLLYRDTGRLDEALQQAERMLEATPDHELGPTYHLLGTLYEEAGRQSEAVSAYEQAIAYAPGLYQAQVALGNLYLQLGRVEEALQSFQAVAQLLPEDYTSHQRLAIIYRQLGRYDDALAAANQALELAPETMRGPLQDLIAQIEKDRG